MDIERGRSRREKDYKPNASIPKNVARKLMKSPALVTPETTLGAVRGPAAPLLAVVDGELVALVVEAALKEENSWVESLLTQSTVFIYLYAQPVTDK